MTEQPNQTLGVSPLDASPPFVWSLFHLHLLIRPRRLQVCNKQIKQVCRQAIPCSGWDEWIYQTDLTLNVFIVHFKHVLANTYFYMSTKSRCGQVRERERDRVFGRGVVDVLPKIGVELKYPLSIQISYFRSSGRTISNAVFFIDNAHLMYNAHPKRFRHSFWCIENAHDAN
jgi:hypothetical protein